jgi:competence protein ComGC
MYKIIGSDGKEYGPVSLDQLKQWAQEGRINGQTRIQEPEGGEWKAASMVPELQSLFAAAAAAPQFVPSPISPVAPVSPQQNGLATTSLVLGILSLVCFGILAGIPAVICGHIARSRAKSAPAQYGGAGLALTGLILGYFSLVLTFLVLPAMLLPALAKAKERAQQISCQNNLRMVGTALRMWSMDHSGQYPFNTSTNSGGTLELCSRGTDGFDRNSAVHFLVMSNELSTPKVLLCPADSSKQVTFDWANLQTTNITYQLDSKASPANPQQVLVICPIHGTALLCDGSVQSRPNSRKRR